jgi:ABC-type Fe3+/spermidine/putrescine transport system ATPase subunit
LSSIAIEGARRSFASVLAVRDITLKIEDGEFFTLLGPSGCGKTTLLRLIAGFAELEAGRISFGDTRIDRLPPHRRNIGMVFQNYAIFPNLSVAGNVAYGLKARHVARADVSRRVEEALALVRLTGLGERWPHQLSGGQLQRVAIARALVIRPEVLLLDEPLSNLDARLRVDMRGEIRHLQQRLGITTVYVTHDQEEALAVSQRIAVMEAGRIEQLGSPEDVYRQPASLFVARFMGTTNVLAGIVAACDGERMHVRIATTTISLPALHDARDGDRLHLCVRPEALRIVRNGEGTKDGEIALAATMANCEFIGPLIRLDLALSDGSPLKLAMLDRPLPPAAAGDRVTVAFPLDRLSIFPQAVT